jgi:endonuclease G, mitochondrial
MFCQGIFKISKSKKENVKLAKNYNICNGVANLKIMKNKITILSILCMSLFGVSQQPAPKSLENCNQFIPYGQPISTKQLHTVYRCRTGYYLESDIDAKIPVWVAYTLTPEHSDGCVTRLNSFTPDLSLPKDERADPKDYVKSGFDIGHIAPDSDMSWDASVARESFILSNTAPQLPHLNRGSWKLLESDVRAWTLERNHTLLVYAGPIYNIATDKKIGIDKIDVPTQFYKVIIDTNTAEVLSFIFLAAGTNNNNLASVQVPEATVQALAGISFPLPANYKEDNIWLVDLNTFNKAKKVKCR